jgi:hypothetical protein
MSLKQKIFQEVLLGTLIYSVVLGFFNDYTNIIEIKSYSITFLLAFVLQILTLATLWVKNQVVKNSKTFQGKQQKMFLVFGVWAVSFFSKFIFLWVIGLVFGNTVNIDGFFNILIIVLTMLLVQKTISAVDRKLS